MILYVLMLIFGVLDINESFYRICLDKLTMKNDIVFLERLVKKLDRTIITCTVNVKYLLQ